MKRWHRDPLRGLTAARHGPGIQKLIHKAKPLKGAHGPKALSRTGPVNVISVPFVDHGELTSVANGKNGKPLRLRETSEMLPLNLARAQSFSVRIIILLQRLL